MGEDSKKVKVFLRNIETQAYILVPFLTEQGVLDPPLTLFRNFTPAQGRCLSTTVLSSGQPSQVFHDNLSWS